LLFGLGRAGTRTRGFDTAIRALALVAGCRSGGSRGTGPEEAEPAGVSSGNPRGVAGSACLFLGWAQGCGGAAGRAADLFSCARRRVEAAWENMVIEAWSARRPPGGGGGRRAGRSLVRDGEDGLGGGPMRTRRRWRGRLRRVLGDAGLAAGLAEGGGGRGSRGRFSKAAVGWGGGASFLAGVEVER